MNIRLICLLFLWLPFAIALDEPLASSHLTVKLWTTIEKRQLPTRSLYLIPIINWSDPTVLYISDWMESPNSTSVNTAVSAYLKRKDHNVIVVEWKEIAAESYESAASSPADNEVGRTIAIALKNSAAAGLDSTSLHIVSHSPESSVAGFVGGNMNFTLSRITGLDPAGPGFLILVQGLSSTNAQFVDAMHTDAGIYGTLSKDSSVNFYMNGGSRAQPGCSLVSLPSTEAGKITNYKMSDPAHCPLVDMTSIHGKVLNNHSRSNHIT